MKKLINNGCTLMCALKWDLKMKMTAFFLLVCMLQINATTYSQKTRISLDMNDVQLSEVLNRLETISEFKFFVDTKKIDVKIEVAIKANKENIFDILDKLFQETDITYEVYKKQILLKKVDSAPTSPKSSSPDQSYMEIKKMQQTITGTITDENGTPLPGANILEKGTTNGTQADFDGNFTLAIEDESAVLVISYIGFATKEVSINGQTTILVTLVESAAGLEEVVVVGYGTQERKIVTSAILSVDEDNLDNRPITSVQQGLSGLTPGVSINLNNGGRPGQNPSLNIRGSFTGVGADAQSPLVLIDGFEGDINDVDPNAIKSISILKDAAASSIYGLQAAAGVILITTKSGTKNTAPTIIIKHNVGLQSFTKIPELVSSTDYMLLKNKGAYNSAVYLFEQDPNTVSNTIWYSDELIGKARSGEFDNTNWTKELYAQSALQTTTSLGVSGGSEKSTYFLNMTYLNQNGINVASDNWERYNLQLKLESDITNWLTLGANWQFIHKDQNAVPILSGREIRAVPLYPVKTADGTFVVGENGSSANPIMVSQSGSYNFAKDYTNQIQLNAKVAFSKNFTFEENVNFRIINGGDKQWTTTIDHLAYDVDEVGYTEPVEVTALSSDRSLYLSSDRLTHITTQSLFRYENSWDKHQLSFVGGLQTEKIDFGQFDARRENFLNDQVQSFQVGGTETGLNNGSMANSSSNMAMLGRINYNFDRKYIVEATLRNDYSSQFAPGYRSAIFPSFSGAWNIAEENFIVNQLPFITLAKIRASWAQAGQDTSPNLAYIQLVNQNNGYPWSFGMEPGLAIINFASPDLTWETNTTTNYGFDLNLWNGGLSLSADIFKTKKTDMLVETPVTDEFGLNRPYYDNLWSAETKGFEVSLGHSKVLGNFNYGVQVNMSNSKSKWTDLAGADSFVFGGRLIKENEAIGIPYAYVSDGLITDQEDLINYQNEYTFISGGLPGRFVGDLKLKDVSGPDGVPDGIIDQEDRRPVFNGDGEYRFGGSFNASYKGIGFSMIVAGIFNRLAPGNLRVNQSEQGFSGGFASPFAFHKRAFDPENPDANALLPILFDLTQDFGDNSDFWYKEASFVRVKNIRLSYQLGSGKNENLGFIDNVLFYVSAENPLLLWDNFDLTPYGFDPESGLGFTGYPIPKTYSFGINITL